MEKINASFHLQRDPTFPFDKARLVDESSHEEGCVNALRAGCITLTGNMQPSWNVARNGNPVTQEGLPLLQNSFNMNKAHNFLLNSSWTQEIQSILPLEGNNWRDFSLDMKKSGICFASSTVLNAGSLVLDSSRGELVNALKKTSKEILEAKALAASRSHSEAERRRRERINTHLATLRTIVPSSTKSDKASLLAGVIDQMKRLKRQVSDVYCYGSLPSENDELTVEGDPTSEKMIRVSLCCDDRPDLMAELEYALDTLKCRTIKIEMSTLGDRTKNNLLVAPKDDCGEHNANFLIKRVQEALKPVVERPGGGELLQENFSKRQRLINVDGKVDC